MRGSAEARVDFLAGVTAKAADQFLIAYIVLTRFSECTPYALCFTLAHCLELSVKAAYWSTMRQKPPKTYRILDLMERLPQPMQDAMSPYLPGVQAREKFKEFYRKQQGSFVDMLRAFFAANPRFKDDDTQIFFSIYHSMDLKYGIDAQDVVLQLMTGTIPKLNFKALRLISIARKHFVNANFHHRNLVDFIARLTDSGAIQPSTLDILTQYLKTGSAPDSKQVSSPASPFLFTSSDFTALKQALSLD
jgi:hypothetical protein